MQVRDFMSTQVVTIAPDESASVAARLLRRYNIGVLPVCNADLQVQGMITDRDIVLRCVAADSNPQRTKVRDIMSGHVIAVSPDLDAQKATTLMGREQVRRLPVCEGGKLVGMLSLGDMALQNDIEASEALSEISQNLKRR